ncbi:MAG: hypothetical protein V3S64_14510, partial [bacterium]
VIDIAIQSKIWICPGVLLLAAHGIDGYRAAFQVGQFQQSGYRGDLIALGLGSQLAESEFVGPGPSADHVNRGIVARPIKRAPERLTVNGDQISFLGACHRLDP